MAYSAAEAQELAVVALPQRAAAFRAVEFGGNAVLLVSPGVLPSGNVLDIVVHVHLLLPVWLAVVAIASFFDQLGEQRRHVAERHDEGGFCEADRAFRHTRK